MKVTVEGEVVVLKEIFKALGYFILYFCLTMIFQTLFSIVFMGIGATNGIRNEKLIIDLANNNILGTTIISGILTILVFYIIFKTRKKDIKSEWKLKKFKLKDIILPIIMSFSYSIFFALITYNISLENSIMISDSVRYYSEMLPMFGIVLMVINLLLIAPISEELVLRGVVYTRAEKGNNPIIAIIISSLLFGCMHFAAGGGVLVIGAILMGGIFSYIFYKYDSLWICIISHIVANLPDFILFNHSNISSNLIIIFEILFAIIFIISFILMFKKKQTSE